MGDWVRIIHPETGGTASVHQGALSHLYASGWQLQAAPDAPQPPVPAPAPVPADVHDTAVSDLSEES